MLCFTAFLYECSDTTLPRRGAEDLYGQSSLLQKEAYF